MRRPIIADPSAALGAAVALILAARNHKPRPPTEAELAEQAKRDERTEWNRQVEARKAAKKGSK